MAQMDYIEQVCKLGQGKLCCRYLVIGGTGFQCMKADDYGRALIDLNWSKTVHVAMGDNCSGKDPIPDRVDNRTIE